MRSIGPILAALAVLSLLTGCTSTQLKEAGQGIAGGLFEMVLDIATDGPERRAEERRRWADNPANRWSACLSPCDIGRDKPTREELEEEARQKRLADAQEYEAEVDQIIQALDEGERQSGSTSSGATARDYEREELERLRRRAETYDDWAEYDEFMRKLEKAEQQSDDPPSITPTSQ